MKRVRGSGLGWLVSSCSLIAWGVLAVSGCGPAAGGPDESIVVLYGGGETTDFGNGTPDLCSTTTTQTPISEEEARGLGIDLEAEQAWLGEPHRAALSWAAGDCATAPEACAPTEIELRAEIESYVRIDGRSGRLDPLCEPEWQALAYRARLALRTQDGRVRGTFLAQLRRRVDAQGERGVLARATPDLRNFEGTLPLRLELERPHFAYLDLSVTLGQSGGSSGWLEPAVVYYDTSRRFGETIGARGGWDSAGLPEVRAAVRDGAGEAVTLSSYRGSSEPPLVALSASAESLNPSTAMDVTIRVDGEIVLQQVAESGTRFELGEHPFGVQVSMDVRNTQGAGSVRASLSQDDCGVGSRYCEAAGCTAHAEYVTGLRLCPN